MTEPAIFTIVSNNYLHFARTLLQSAAKYHPQSLLYCVIVDTDPEPSSALAQEFRVISLDQLKLPDGDDFLFQYNVLELNTAVKPWALQHLLEQGHDQVFYIDPDIQIHNPLSEVQDLLRQGADIVLTPHLLAPMTDEGHPSELDIRRAGTYNLGFCAVRDTPNTRQYLTWWQGKLQRDCIIAHDRGVFVDQSWVDLAPGLFDNVAILRHPGYNAAYWNLAQRNITRQSDPACSWLVNGLPLVFFHFSGLNPLDPHKISKHQGRFTLDNVGSTVSALVSAYCQQVVDNGIQIYRKLSYGYGTYSNGVTIDDAQRARFRSSDALRKACGGKPFSRPDLLAPPPPAPQAMLPQADSSSFAVPLTHGSDALFRTLAGQRLLRIYQELLGRNPDTDAIRARLALCEAPAGMYRTALAVGLSSEARARPGWAYRLLSMASSTRHTPAWVQKWAVQPLLGTILPPLPPAAPVVAPVQSTDGTSVSVPTQPQSLAALPSRTLLAPTGPVSNLPSPVGINLVGYIAAELGLGEAARSLARACHAVNVPFSATDVGYQSQNLQRDTSVLKLASPHHYPIDLLYVNADQTPATVQQLQMAGKVRGRYTIGFWHWEQPQLPVHLLQAFAHVDEVWVPSTFVHDAVSPVSPVPVFKVPHALEFEATPGVQRSQFGLPDGLQLVLVMYDFHSYQHRKNPQAAIEAYRKAARQQPNLGLVIKTINSQHHAEAYAVLRSSVQDLPHVHFIDEFLTRQQTWDLQACCDVLLSLHRAEGFGLAPAEMMHLGKPVVATGWSANMDFMNAGNSMPVRYRLEPLARDVGAYLAGPMWAEADTDHAAECLIQLICHPELAQRLGHQAALDIRSQLSPAVVGQQIRQRLQMLGHWHPDLLRV
jgi:glycosyltransferase involved in cell wall biosynthesis